MTSPKQLLRTQLKVWLLAFLTSLLLASQCDAPATPPLPVTPAGSVIRVALLTPEAGELATFGRMMRNGITMAFEEWNNQGGVLDHRIEWVTYETGCEFETAQQAVQQAVEDGIRFIIGPLCSEAAIAAAEEAEASDILMISPTATHPLVTVNSQGQTRPTVFRIAHAYPAQGQATARFAKETLDADKAALFTYPSDDYTRILADSFAQQFNKQGGAIVYRVTYTPGDIDFTEQLMAIRNSGAEIIYLPVPVQIVNQVAGQLKELTASNSTPSPEPILLGSDSWESSELDLEATEGSYFTTHFAGPDSSPMTQTWAEAYKSNYAIEPETLAVLGYDAALVLLTAIQQAGTVDRLAVAKSLEHGTFEGVTGKINFDSQHNPIKPVPIMAIKDGQVISSAAAQP
jgi:branched-chain amino acid transport system substrate-binding protein